jgi:single-strand DNA-binding protein
MASINRCELLGNVGQDPEIRTLQGSSRVATFSLATSKTWIGEGGEKQEKTQWHKCVVFDIGKRKLVDVVEQYVHKGDRVLLDGEIEYRQWQDKEGATRYSTEIRVRELHLLTPRTSGDASTSASASRTAKPAAPKAGASKPAASRSDDDFVLDDPEDDLPF